MDVVVGQKVTGKFQTSNGFGTRPILIFPHGEVTKIDGDLFEVKYDEIKGTFHYKESDIDKIVYLKEKPLGELEEQMDYELERQRLGIEE